MALVYGVLGVIVILTAGTFGTINASPWFNLGIAALFVVLGLAMFDVIIGRLLALPEPARASARRAAARCWLAFSMGAIAALLAGACVAPVVIQVVVFASNLLRLRHLDRAGAALRPRARHGACRGRSPAPGWRRCPSRAPWMVRVKQAMGVVILATAVYYGYIAYGIFANRWVDPASVQASVAEKLKEGWHSSLTEGLHLPRVSRTRRPSSISGPRGARTASSWTRRR